METNERILFAKAFLEGFHNPPDVPVKYYTREDLVNIECTIREYSDHFSNWYGLEDGTMLELGDPLGRQWVKIGKETMTVEEFNAHR